MADEKKQADPRTVQLKRVRLSFTDSLMDKKPTVKDGTPKHTCNVILEAVGDDPKATAAFETNKKLVFAGMTAACVQQFGEGKGDLYKAIAEDNPMRVVFRKGERFKNADDEVYEGYAGNMVVAGAGPRAGVQRPKLLDRHKRDVEVKDIADVFYSGTYADVIISFYAVDGKDKGGRGVFCSIEAIRSHQEGKRMAGGGANVSADDFDDLGDEDAFEGASAGGAAAGDDFG